jgi:hypothetical protein
VTQWVESPEGGRERGPVGLFLAWVEVLVRPRRFFRNGIAPGDQAPGLVFAVAVTLAYVIGLFALVPSARPVIADRPTVSLVFALVAVGLILAPLVLHLTAALGTLSLMAVVEERAGVSQTVQVIAYSAAPCALAGVPYPPLRLVAAAYGWVLLVVGFATVHRTGLGRAAVAAFVPAALVFGYGFGGFGAAVDVALGVAHWIEATFGVDPVRWVETTAGIDLSVGVALGAFR